MYLCLQSNNTIYNIFSMMYFIIIKFNLKNTSLKMPVFNPKCEYKTSSTFWSAGASLLYYSCSGLSFYLTLPYLCPLSALDLFRHSDPL